MALAEKMVRLDSDRNKTYNKIQDMWDCKWELPTGLKGLNYIREFITTGPHDAMLAASRTFSSQMPFISVMPLSASDRQHSEDIEEALEWHLFRALRRSPFSPLYGMMNTAVMFSEIAGQVDYLPYTLKDQTKKRVKSIKGVGDFIIRIHDPRTVHATYSDYGLEEVLSKTKVSVQDVINRFGEEHKGIKKLKDQYSDDTSLFEEVVELYDLTDSTDRVVWVGAESPIELIREPHGLPFINWVYRRNDHPLMLPVVNADLYNNANVMSTLRFSLVMSAVAQSKTWSRTPSGDGVEIDHSDPTSQAQMKMGEEFGILPPSQLDPNINLLVQEVAGDIRQATVAEALTSIEKIAGSSPFSTVNAIIQAALSSLAPIRKLGENALEDMLYLFLEFIKHSGEPLIAYRTKTREKDNPVMEMGAQIQLNPDEIEPNNVYLEVNLQPDTPTDKQGRLDMAIKSVQNLSVTPRKAMEDNGLEYTDADMDEFMEWQYAQAELQGDLTAIQAKTELEIQKAQMDMQMQGQQQMQQQQQSDMLRAQTQQTNAQAQQANQTDPFANTRGMGRTDGNPPINSRPGVGREQINGETRAGDELA